MSDRGDIEHKETAQPEAFSGDKHHGGNAGIEFPVERFDMRLEEAVEEKKVLSLEDHGILTQEELDARSALDAPKRSRKKVIAAGAGVAALLVAGAALFMPKDDNEERQATPETTTPTTDQSATTEPQETTTTVEENTNGEVVTVNGLDLVIPNGETPEEILDAIGHNMEQVSNFVDFSDRTEQQRFNEQFVKYVAYEPGDEISSQLLEMWQGAQLYRQGDIFVEYNIEYSDVSVISRTDDLLQVEATVTDGTAAPIRRQITLRLGEISTPNGIQPAWLIKYYQTI